MRHVVLIIWLLFCKSPFIYELYNNIMYGRNEHHIIQKRQSAEENRDILHD